jgi:virginiamycin A acetyltransferase
MRMVGGNPARLIRFRFSENDIKRLLDIKWWDWSAEKITRNLEYINSANVDDLEKAAEVD